MKKTLLFLLLLVSVGAFSQGKVEADGKIKPTGSHTIVDTKDVQGNVYDVETITERNAIPDNRRTEGFIAFVKADSKHYTLRGGKTNAFWVEFSVGGSSGGGGAIKEPVTNF